MPLKHGARQVQQWDIFELVLEGPDIVNPFTEIYLKGRFTCNGRIIEQEGFYDGNGTYNIRIMPDIQGNWAYRIFSSSAQMDGITGSFTCIKPSGMNHGPVRVRDTYHFVYEDGTAFYPFGTTCYAWTHQGNELEEQTLTTLSASPFNKIRMCVFPKHYDYNNNEPEIYPFERNAGEGWDFERFNPEFFRHLELRLKNLMELGIEADLILFHPYDRWGFSVMGSEADERYLKYIVTRLSAFRNVWWSLANEYDLMNKSVKDWERYAEIIMQHDPYCHLRSIHNCILFYDHTRPWITHCSIQRVDIYKTTELVNEWRERYRKPVIVDECAYEGNISHGWGNISDEELVRRFWEGMLRGGYVTHGETYLDPKEILWWSKGGRLHGSSPPRIAFLKKIIEEGPKKGLTYMPLEWDSVCGGIPNEYYIFYFGFFRPSFRIFHMPEGIQFKVDVIDTWDMTINVLPVTYKGDFRVELPGKSYIAVRMRKVS